MREWIETMRTPPNKTEGGYEYQGRIDMGTEYIDPVSRERKKFIGEDGRKYIGLLNGRGEPLQHGEDLHILWFAIDVVNSASSGADSKQTDNQSIDIGPQNSQPH